MPTGIYASSKILVGYKMENVTFIDYHKSEEQTFKSVKK